MARNRFRIFTLVAALSAGAILSHAATIVVGLEDTPGSSGYEKNGDFNDMFFELTGNITIDAPGGVFNNLTSSVVNENGAPFWDNPSLDGSHKNIGYILLGDSQFQNLEYLATPGGSSVNDVTFDATGTVTLTYLGGIAGNVKSNTLGWYNPAHPGTLNPLSAWPDAPGESVTFNPNGDFALFSSDGNGQTYSSIAASNKGESGSQQHFAFFTQPACDPPQVPEPSSAALVGIGAALLGLGMLPRRQPTALTLRGSDFN